ncbi:hypothetical protein LguiA_015464 [Lonicera macranthoides]
MDLDLLVLMSQINFTSILNNKNKIDFFQHEFLPLHVNIILTVLSRLPFSHLAYTGVFEELHFRNNVVWNGKSEAVGAIFSRAMGVLSQWQSAQVGPMGTAQNEGSSHIVMRHGINSGRTL